MTLDVIRDRKVKRVDCGLVRDFEAQPLYTQQRNLGV